MTLKKDVINIYILINDLKMNENQKGILLLGFFIVMLCGCSENDEQPIESSKTNADIIMTSQNFCTEGKLWTGIESTEIRKTPFSYKIQGDTIISTYGCKKVYYPASTDFTEDLLKQGVLVQKETVQQKEHADQDGDRNTELLLFRFMMKHQHSQACPGRSPQHCHQDQRCLRYPPLMLHRK